MPRMSIEVGYFHRWLTNFTTTDNTALSAADFTEFTFTAPRDPRLPDGGGYAIPGLLNVTAAALTRAAANNITFSDNFGGQSQVYDGVLINLSARAANGLTFQGGINTGKTVQDFCDLRAQLPELSVGFFGSVVGATNPYCKNDPGFITKVTGLVSYTVPRIDVLLAATLRSDQGAPLRATYNAPVADVSAALGRPAAAFGTTVPIDLVAPGDVWGDRVNELNLRFAKVLRFGGTRTHVGVDLFNVLNSDAILTYNQTFQLPSATLPNGSWLVPQSVLTPRFMKVSAQIDF
jgi:hypothetical protein